MFMLLSVALLIEHLSRCNFSIHVCNTLPSPPLIALTECIMVPSCFAYNEEISVYCCCMCMCVYPCRHVCACMCTHMHVCCMHVCVCVCVCVVQNKAILKNMLLVVLTTQTVSDVLQSCSSPTVIMHTCSYNSINLWECMKGCKNLTPGVWTESQRDRVLMHTNFFFN